MKNKALTNKIRSIYWMEEHPLKGGVRAYFKREITALFIIGPEIFGLL